MHHFANAFADALRKNAARIIMILFMIFTLTAGIILDTRLSLKRAEGIYAFSEAPAEPNSEPENGKTEKAGIWGKKESAEILIPHCDSILYSASDGKNDFSFTNPKANDCYLKVSITRRDNSETIYSSTLISPGKSISDISFSKKLSASGVYEVMIKVDAYSKVGLYLLNSLVMKTEITVY